MIVKFTIPSSPAPKKNSGRIVFVGPKCRTCNRGKFPKVLPSKAWDGWAQEALKTIQFWRPIVVLPLIGEWNVAAIFYRKDAREVDTVNLCEGLADVLELCGIVDDDLQLVTWNGTEPPRIDRKNPRTEVELVMAEVKP